jgi:4-hydroxybenzoate polyprenyltransferase
MAVESLVSAVLTTPLKTFGIIVKNVFDRAALKCALTNLHQPDPQALPYRKEVLKLIMQKKAEGVPVLLVTAAAEPVAQRIAAHLGVFDGVRSSTPDINLKGHNKANYLIAEFGKDGYDYIGDCFADIPVWQSAHEKFLAENTSRAFTKLSKHIPDLQQLVCADNFSLFRTVLKTLRCHQWVKNLLLFLPLFLAHELTRPLLFVQAFLAFCAFSLCASAVYILNDIVDIESDRQHPVKAKRPLAAGHITMTTVLLLLPVLLVSGLLLAALISYNFLLTMLFYMTITTLYSFCLKRLLIFDIITLALLYTLRIVAGGVATDILVTQWLLGFSLFFFFSLAAVKRYQELLTAEHRGKKAASGRDYQTIDRLPIGILGASSGVVSVMILALYVNSPDVTALYKTPRTLLGLCPPILYWISRIWLLTNRGEMHADPIIFAIKDKASYWVGLVCALILVIASY